MYFKDELGSINAYICISVHTVSGNIAGIAAILPETNLHAESSIAATLQQYCRNIARNCCCNIAAILPETNLHVKSSIAATLQQYCHNIARNCCCNIAAIYCQKACISIRDNSFIKRP